MEPRFPVFLKDRDGWMYLIKSKEELGQFERIDVEGNEYSGWDVAGNHLDLKVKEGEVLCFISDGGGQSLEELKTSIVSFAKKMGPKDLLFLSTADDVFELFIEAERHVRKSDLLHRVMSFFKGLWAK